MRIGIDIMGGDYAPKTAILGAIAAKKELTSNQTLVLLGDKELIVRSLNENNASEADFEIVHTTEVIGMAEHPTKALPQKPNSSISVGFAMLKQGLLDGFGSAGNTGAMFVGSIMSVKPIEGILRPCLLTILPKLKGGEGILLDAGANADCKPEVLEQFALLGKIYSEGVMNIQNPKIGLLNIGEEKGKGNILCQATYPLLEENKQLNFIGNIEGRDLFEDAADVVVCDGFTGNIALKQAEAMYTLVRKRGIKDEYFNRFNPENYGGSPVLGVNSTVIVQHGSANELAMKNMILLTRDVVEAKLSDKIKKAL